MYFCWLFGFSSEDAAPSLSLSLSLAELSELELDDPSPLLFDSDEELDSLSDLARAFSGFFSDFGAIVSCKPVLELATAHSLRLERR